MSIIDELDGGGNYLISLEIPSLKKVMCFPFNNIFEPSTKIMIWDANGDRKNKYHLEFENAYK